MRVFLIFALFFVFISLSEGGSAGSKTKSRNNPIQIRPKPALPKLSTSQAIAGGVRNFQPANANHPERRHSLPPPQLRPSSTVSKQDQEAAIKQYTTNDYVRINRYLRGQNNPGRPVENLNNFLRNKDTRTTVQNADSAFTRTGGNLPPVKTTYRGTTKEFVEKNRNVKTNDLIDPGFSSTSKDKAVASGFAADSASKFQGTPVVLNVVSNHGKPIEHLSKYPGEKEVLFQPGTKFVQTGKTPDEINLWGTRNPPNNRRYSTSQVI